MRDARLTRWSSILLLLAGLTALLSIVAPLFLLSGESPIMLANKGEIWKTTLGQLPHFEATLCVIILFLPDLTWVYAVVQIAILAQHYRLGHVFEEKNMRCFTRIGGALALMGVLSMLSFPALNYLLFYRHISPWLADMPLLGILEPDLLMAGAFFFILGKIMQRGCELQATDRLTV